jgi:hypothetical protein
MLKRFHLKSGEHDLVVGRLNIDYENDIWEYKVNNEHVEQPYFVAHCRLAGRDYTKEDVKCWVLERAPEEDYELIVGVLEEMGLEEYDAYKIFLKNNGIFITDKFYVVDMDGML